MLHKFVNAELAAVCCHAGWVCKLAMQRPHAGVFGVLGRSKLCKTCPAGSLLPGAVRVLSSAQHNPRSGPTSLVPKHVAVVGAGVGGVAAVGALAASGVRVSWFDPSFSAGAFERYGEVPSNTKVDLLAAHLEALLPLGIPDGPARDALNSLKANAFALDLKADPASGWCNLGAVGNVLSAMTKDVLARSLGVRCVLGNVVRARQTDSSCVAGGWLVDWDDADGVAGQPFPVDAVVLSPGCLPGAVPHDLLPDAWAWPADVAADKRLVRTVPLEEALQPCSLHAHLIEAGDGAIAVVGGGHSGIVMVRALLGLASVDYVKLFMRRPLRLAEWDAQVGIVQWNRAQLDTV